MLSKPISVDFLGDFVRFTEQTPVSESVTFSAPTSNVTSDDEVDTESSLALADPKFARLLARYASRIL